MDTDVVQRQLAELFEVTRSDVDVAISAQEDYPTEITATIRFWGRKKKRGTETRSETTPASGRRPPA